MLFPCLCAALFAGLTHAGETDVPRWRVAEADLRVRATHDGPFRYARVEIPAFTSVRQPVAALQAWAGDVECETRVAWRDGETLDVWVDLGPADRGQDFAVYGIPGPDPLMPDEAFFAERRPVQATVWRLGGQDPASDWERMRWAQHHAGDPVTRFRLPTFMHVDGSRDDPPQWVRRREHARTQYLARLSARLRVPDQKRRGRLSIQAPHPTALLIDGRVRATWPADSVRDGWALGDTLLFEGAPHLLEVFQSCEQILSLRVGIWWEGDDAPLVLTHEHLAPDLPPSPAIVERIDEILHPAMVVEPLPAYRFLGVETVFRPVRLRDASFSRLGTVADVYWGAGSEEWGRGNNLHRVLTREGPLQVEALVVNSLGFRRGHVQTIDDDPLPLREFRLASTWRGLPAAAWPDDRMRPGLWVFSTAPDQIELEVEIRKVSLFNEVGAWTEPLAIAQGVGRVEIPEFAAGSLKHLRAVVRHAGVALSRAEARFVHPPFSSLPDAVSGEALLQNGTQWVLVARNRARLEMPAMPAVNARRLVWIEDPVIDAAPAAVERSRNEFALSLKEKLSLSSIQRAFFEDQSVDRTGAHGVRALPALSRFCGFEVAVVALGSAAAHAGTPPDRFERQLAAVAGLLSEALKLDVILATPLPHGDPEALRPYAAAVHRVADAYALPVLDRYSFLMSQSETGRLLTGSRLTPLGIERLSAWVAGRFDPNT